MTGVRDAKRESDDENAFGNAPFAAISSDGHGDRSDLVDLIGKTAVIALAEEFGGTRLYIPSRSKACHPITRAVGPEASQVLCDHYSSATIRVPLARELRAQRYRDDGLSNARIAVRLGLTESGVRNLFKRLEKRG